MEQEVLPDFVVRQRWFGAKDAQFLQFESKPLATLEGIHGTYPGIGIRVPLWATQFSCEVCTAGSL
jgi:hypothetical protein